MNDGSSSVAPSPNVRVGFAGPSEALHLPVHARPREFVHLFDYADDIDRAVIDLTDAHIWDTLAVAAIDAVVAKFAAHDIDATLHGLNAHSAGLHGATTGSLVSSH